jgi:hypothetical protein
MAKLNVTITGASRDAKLSWSGKPISLTSASAGSYAATFQRAAEEYVYSIVVFGDPGDSWTAQVTDSASTNNHAGHMSPSGYDTTGDTPFTVSK